MFDWPLVLEETGREHIRRLGLYLHVKGVERPVAISSQCLSSGNLLETVGEQ